MRTIKQTILFILVLVVCMGMIAATFGCSTSINADEGVELKEAQAYISLFPACPDLPKDPAAAKEIVLAWLSTLKEIAGSLPAGLHAEIHATIDRSASGEVVASADVQAQIEAAIQEAFKDFVSP